MTDIRNTYNRNYGVMIYMLALLYLIRIGFVFLNGVGIFQITFTLLFGVTAVVLAILRDSRFSNKYFRSNIAGLIAYVVIIFFLTLVTGDVSYRNSSSIYIKNCMSLFVIWGIYNLLYMSSVKTKKIVVSVYFIGIVLSSAYTLFVAVTGPALIIRMTAVGEYYTNLFPLKYGGYDFIFTLVIIYTGLISFTSKNRQKLDTRQRSIVIGLLVLFAFTIVASDYTTAFLLILIITVWNIFTKKSTRFVIIIVIFAAFVFFPRVIASIVSKIPFMQELTGNRINELIYFFSRQSVVSDFNGEGNRLGRAIASLKIILEHPLIGGYAGNTALTFGNHTEWIDTVAKYGIPASIGFFAFWQSSFKNLIIDSSLHNREYVIKMSAFMLIALGFADPVSLDVTVAPLFVLCPFFDDVFLGERIFRIRIR